MANLLDEVTGPVNDNGRDIHVIDKQIPVEVGFGSTLFEIALWVAIPILVLIFVAVMGSQLENPRGGYRGLPRGHAPWCGLHLHENLSPQLLPAA